MEVLLPVGRCMRQHPDIFQGEGGEQGDPLMPALTGVEPRRSRADGDRDNAGSSAGQRPRRSGVERGTLHFRRWSRE